MSKPTFTMMAGLVGSGKSTYAKQLAEETNAIICSSDAIREELYGDEIHKITTMKYSKYYIAESKKI